ncbi:MAG: DUF1810 family protein [Rhizobiales bacterium]|nr:DUF1810 family protein [Rhizobiaceae bacterium]MBA4799799.1 DUF1810 family protein [Hyphomicrobiales bacterium]
MFACPATPSHSTRKNVDRKSSRLSRAGVQRHGRAPIPPKHEDAGALRRSPTANFYGISSIAEACYYLRHPVLANRLARAVDAVLGVAGRSAHEIFGSPDDLKFRSSMTPFSKAAGEEGERFRLALERFFAGEPDPVTPELLGGGID